MTGGRTNCFQPGDDSPEEGNYENLQPLYICAADFIGIAVGHGRVRAGEIRKPANYDHQATTVRR